MDWYKILARSDLFIWRTALPSLGSLSAATLEQRGSKSFAFLALLVTILPDKQLNNENHPPSTNYDLNTHHLTHTQD